MREAAAKEEVAQESAIGEAQEMSGEAAVKVETVNGAKFY